MFGLLGRSILNIHHPINSTAYGVATGLAAVQSGLLSAKTAQEESVSMKTAAAFAVTGAIFGMGLPDAMTDASLFLGQTPLGPASQKLVDTFIDNKGLLCLPAAAGIAVVARKLRHAPKKTEEYSL